MRLTVLDLQICFEITPHRNKLLCCKLVSYAICQYLRMDLMFEWIISADKLQHLYMQNWVRFAKCLHVLCSVLACVVVVVWWFSDTISPPTVQRVHLSSSCAHHANSARINDTYRPLGGSLAEQLATIGTHTSTHTNYRWRIVQHFVLGPVGWTVCTFTCVYVYCIGGGAVKSVIYKSQKCDI